MQIKINRISLMTILLSMIFTVSPVLTNAQKEQEPACLQCIESPLPQTINYGQSTCECMLDNFTDSDVFNFGGARDDRIRIGLTWDPPIELCYEVLSPSGVVVVGNNCPGGATLREITLTEQGKYVVAVHDQGYNETGSYEIQVDCILGDCPSCSGTTTSTPTTTTSPTTSTSVPGSCTYGSCETTSECTAAFGKRWACVNGCCENTCPILALEYDEAQLDTIRRFRDEVLSKTPVGKEIIELYYQWGPMIASMMEEDEVFKGEVKELIDSILPMIKSERE
jgi:hypothetical protein